MYRFRLQDNSGNRYDSDMIVDVNQRTTKPVLSIALPGESYKNNILLGLSGMESDISISFNIWNDGTDRSNGDNIVTVNEQINYLKNTVFNPNASASFELWIYDTSFTNANMLIGDTTTSSGLDVLIEDIDIPLIALDSPRWRRARIDVVVGNLR